MLFFVYRSKEAVNNNIPLSATTTSVDAGIDDDDDDDEVSTQQYSLTQKIIPFLRDMKTIGSVL